MLKVVSMVQMFMAHQPPNIRVGDVNDGISHIPNTVYNITRHIDGIAKAKDRAVVNDVQLQSFVVPKADASGIGLVRPILIGFILRLFAVLDDGAINRNGCASHRTVATKTNPAVIDIPKAVIQLKVGLVADNFEAARRLLVASKSRSSNVTASFVFS